MVPAGNKAKRLSSVNHTTKTIDHHHHVWQILFVFRNILLCTLKKYFLAFLKPRQTSMMEPFANNS